MRRTLRVAVATLMVGFWARGHAQGQLPIEPGFESITHWTREYSVPGSATIGDGTLTVREEAGWVRSEGTFRDFTLRFDMLPLSAATQALVIVRGVAPAGPTPGAGFGLPLTRAVALMPALPDMRLDVPALDPAHLESALNPPGDWQEYEILCEGDLITITLNGLVIFSRRSRQAAEGDIAILSRGGPVAIRNVRSRPVQSEVTPGFRRIEVTAARDDVQLKPWLPGFMQELMRRWPKPAEAETVKGRVDVTLFVQKNGRIGDVVLSGPSPVGAFNEAAREAVTRARPKSLPARYPAAQAQLTVTFFNNDYPVPPHPVGVYRAGRHVAPPRLVQEAQPRYTNEAMRARVQGLVVLECVINADGSVGALQVLRSLDPTYGLDEEAIKAVRRWKFQPATRLGRPVPVLGRCELEFEIRN